MGQRECWRVGNQKTWFRLKGWWWSSLQVGQGGLTGVKEVTGDKDDNMRALSFEGVFYKKHWSLPGWWWNLGERMTMNQSQGLCKWVACDSDSLESVESDGLSFILSVQACSSPCVLSARKRVIQLFPWHRSSRKNFFSGSLAYSLFFLIHVHFLGDLTKCQGFKHKPSDDSFYMCLQKDLLNFSLFKISTRVFTGVSDLNCPEPNSATTQLASPPLLLESKCQLHPFNCSGRKSGRRPSCFSQTHIQSIFQFCWRHL